VPTKRNERGTRA
jgi:DNA replication protein DnaC